MADVKLALLLRQNVKKQQKKLPNCDLCQKTYSSSTSLRAHLRIKHPELAPEDDYKKKCAVCKTNFTNRRLFATHKCLQETHSCDLCDRKYTSRNSLVFHLRVHRGELKERKCPDCGLVFSSATGAYYAHRRIHREGEPHCHICNKSFQVVANYKIHMRAHEQPLSLSCDQCDRRFTYISSLKRHTRSVHEKRTYLCDLCGLALRSPKSLRDHIRMHVGLKQYSCDYCDKRFVQAEVLKCHLRVHTKERPYKCQFCDKRFTQRAPLLTHTRSTHTKEKPYKCEICEARFVSKALLGIHLKNHPAA